MMTYEEYISYHLTKPFIWGANDCVLFASGWARLKTGQDPLKGIAPWFSMLSAHKVLEKVGGLRSAVDKRLVSVPPMMATDGDLAFHQDSLRLYVGYQICGPGPDGLVFFPRSEAVCAWRC